MPNLFPKGPVPGADPAPFASPGYVHRVLGEQLSQLEIVGDGIDVSIPKPGQVKLRANGGTAGGPWAWQVNVQGTQATITAGEVYVQSGLQVIVPEIDGVALTNEPAPLIAINLVGSTYLYLKAEISKNGAPKNLPWKIESGSTLPASVPLIRPYNGNTGQDGTYYFTIARLEDARVTLQSWLARPIAVTWAYNYVVAW